MSVHQRRHRSRCVVLSAFFVLWSVSAQAQKNTGKFTGIRGKIQDSQGEPLGGVQVVATGAATEEYAITEDDGTYQIALKPGSYNIQISDPLYKPQGFAIQVKRGRAARVDATMEDNESEVIMISGKLEAKTEETQLEIRMTSTSVSDRLSAAEMSRTTDSNAASAAKRVASVTVQGGRYVFLRGLGGRYVTTLMNGVILPSAEPDGQAVPLDIFPTRFLSNMAIMKSYAAELPGTFGGGTMLLDTNTFPSQREVSVKFSLSGNSESLNMPAQARGGSLDFFGFDDGTRALPDAVPTDRPVQASDSMSVDEVEHIGESFSSNWLTTEMSNTPNMSLALSVGDTVPVGGRFIGYLASASFSHNLVGRDSAVAKTRNVNSQLEYREELGSLIGREVGTVGAMINVGATLKPGQQVSLLSMYNHKGESIANTVFGFNETDGQEVDSDRMQWIERSLSFNQIIGTHKLPRKIELKWQGNVSFSSRDEKDTRDIAYNLTQNGGRIFKDQPGSGERFFSDLDQLSAGGGFDFKIPTIIKLDVHTGVMFQASNRMFESRRFRYRFVGNDNSVRTLPANEMLSAEHIGDSFLLTERTLATDAYEANQTIFGAFFSGAYPITKKLQATGGLRFEYAAQDMMPGSPVAVAGLVDEDDIQERTDADLLGALNLRYALADNMNLRAAGSYTLARPKFRELAPFLYFDYVQRRSLAGNPQLLNTHILNADVRWEWFPGGRDLVAASAFYKDFADPIEKVIFSSTGGDSTFDNAAGGLVYGLELEGRTNLGHLHSKLSPFFVGANLSLIRSAVELTEEQLLSQTSVERPLQGQSPYVVNVSASYVDRRVGELSVLYNVIGQRITDVGFDSLPDIYEQPFHRLDLKASRQVAPNWSMSLSATNLLNSRVRLNQGDLTILNYRPGVSISVGMSFTP